MTQHLTFNISSTNCDRSFPITVSINNIIIEQLNIDNPRQITYQFDDTAYLTYEVEICLLSKPDGYTTLDSNGNIISDTLLKISNICIGKTDISQWIFQNSKYICEDNKYTIHPGRFFGSLGIVGCVKFSFNTPSLLWLIENNI